mmetsp:Transcript_148/g.450  ORF Transcript_148/g.450 Transcript_148/m.450 type:complete len:172 (+) Transcript_148:221-736(+)
MSGVREEGASRGAETEEAKSRSDQRRRMDTVTEKAFVRAPMQLPEAKKAKVPPTEQEDVMYSELQRKVQRALEAPDETLGTSGKINLTLEILRARQLELELERSRQSIQAIVSRGRDSGPRTIKAAVASSAVKDLPVGSFIDIQHAMLRLEPASAESDDVLLMTLVIDKRS